MNKSKQVVSMVLAGMIVSFNASAATSQSIGQNDDYDVASVLSAKNRGKITVNEDIKLNSPDDYNVNEVYKAKRVSRLDKSHMGHMTDANRNTLDNVDDY